MTCRLPLIALIALAACNRQPTNLATVEAEQLAAASDSGRIVCARRGSSDFARVCLLDRTDASEGLVLTVRHPDGAFHRLLVTRDGHGVIAADGAQPAHVTVRGSDEIEVELAGDRYRLPATVRGSPKS